MVKLRNCNPKEGYMALPDLALAIQVGQALADSRGENHFVENEAGRIVWVCEAHGEWSLSQRHVFIPLSKAAKA